MAQVSAIILNDQSAEGAQLFEHEGANNGMLQQRKGKSDFVVLEETIASQRIQLYQIRERTQIKM